MLMRCTYFFLICSYLHAGRLYNPNQCFSQISTALCHATYYLNKPVDLHTPQQHDYHRLFLEEKYAILTAYREQFIQVPILSPAYVDQIITQMKKTLRALNSDIVETDSSDDETENSSDHSSSESSDDADESDILEDESVGGNGVYANPLFGVEDHEQEE